MISIGRILRFLCVIPLSFFLAGCSASLSWGTADESKAVPEGIVSIGLPRLAFVDDSPDDSCFFDAGDLLRRHVRYELEKRGYNVVTITAPPRENIFGGDFLADFSAGQLVSLAPELDAVMLVRVEEYLGHDLCDRDSMASLDLKATARLYRTGSGALLWQGAGTGSDLGGSGRDVHFSAGRELAFALFATLSDKE